MGDITLSILVPSAHTRAFTFAQAIQSSLYWQWENLSPLDQSRVEILVWADNKMRPLGQKRNEMVDAAQGRYVAFVDDDDRLTPDYLSTLLGAIDRHPVDVIVFDVSVSINGGAPKPCRYSINYARDYNTRVGYCRLPNHIMCVRREHALRAKFPEISHGEDSEYARRLRPFLETEFNIGRVLYYYDFHSETTETQR